MILGLGAMIRGDRRGVPPPGAASIAGILRFSMLTRRPQGFRRGREGSFEERAAALFAEPRMAARFRHFEALTLPSLAAQSDRDFRLVAVTSTELPRRWRDRLAELEARHPFLTVQEADPDAVPSEAYARAAASALAAEARMHVTFRIDDDDALAAGFVAQLRQNAVRLGPPSGGLSFPRGWIVAADPDGGRLTLRPFHAFGIGCGLALCTWPKQRRTVYDVPINHRKFDQKVPTLADARAAMYVVAAHPWCDSGRLIAEEDGQGERLTPAEAAARLGPDFAALDLAALVRPESGADPALTRP